MRSKELTNFIVKELNSITSNNVLSHKVLISEVLTAFPGLKTREYAANRINHVLANKNVKDNFRKIKGKDGKPYIVKIQQELAI